MRNKGKKCVARTMMHSQADETFKMNVHHVTLRQSVEQYKTREGVRRGRLDESERNEVEV